MSTFDEREQGEATSAPVEGYKFIGTFKTYRYTSTDRSIFIAGEEYLPISVSRSRVKAGTQEDDNLSLDLSIPFDVDVVRDYAYAQTPPKLRLEVYRQQQDLPTGQDFSLFWKGLVRGFSVSGRTASVSVPSIFSLALQGEIPNVYYQAPCNKVLYDKRCKVARAAHTITATILVVTGVQIQLTDVLGSAANLYSAGELVNTRNGERRLILANDRDFVDIGYAFVDLQPGDVVELAKGCDHSLETCKAKFDNVINFGGFNYIPIDNPFEGEL